MNQFENPEWLERYMDIMDKVRAGEWTHEQAEELIESDDIFGEPRILKVRVPTEEEYAEREITQGLAKDFIEETRAKIDELLESGEITKEEAGEMANEAQVELDKIQGKPQKES